MPRRSDAQLPGRSRYAHAARMSFRPAAILLALAFTTTNATGAPVALRDGQPSFQRTNHRHATGEVRWRGYRLRVGWKRYTIGGIRMWHPTIVSRAPRVRSSVLFTATNDESVYWGAPLRVVWLARGDELLVRLVEVTGLGGPAYAACVRLGVIDKEIRILDLAQPGRDRSCPTWADALVAQVQLDSPAAQVRLDSPAAR